MADQPDFIELVTKVQDVPTQSALINLHRRLSAIEANQRLAQFTFSVVRLVVLPVMGLAAIELVRRLVA